MRFPPPSKNHCSIKTGRRESHDTIPLLFTHTDTELIHVFLEKKILAYVKNNIRAPSLQQILQWAKPLGVTIRDAKVISDRAPFRHTMGQYTKMIYKYNRRCPLNNKEGWGGGGLCVTYSLFCEIRSFVPFPPPLFRPRLRCHGAHKKMAECSSH